MYKLFLLQRAGKFPVNYLDQTPTSDFDSEFDEIPAPDILASAIDDYFANCHCEPFDLFHEPSFRDRLSRDEVPDYLLLAILASGIRYSKIHSFAHRRLAAIDQYSNHSWLLVIKRWNSIEEEHDMDIVRAMLMLSAIDFTG